MNINQVYLNDFYKTKLEEHSQEIKIYEEVIEFENKMKKHNQPIELGANFLFPISLTLYLILFISINIFFGSSFIFYFLSFIISFPCWALATIIILIFYEKSICDLFNPIFMKKIKPHFIRKLKPHSISNECFYKIFDNGFKYYVNHTVPSKIMIEPTTYNKLLEELNFSSEEIDKFLYLKKFSFDNDQKNISLFELKELINIIRNYKPEFFTELYDV